MQHQFSRRLRVSSCVETKFWRNLRVFKPPQCSRNAYLSESSSLSAQSILILYDNCIRKREKQEFNYCALVMISFLLAPGTVDLSSSSKTTRTKRIYRRDSLILPLF